jgi:hypothetical protein
MMKISRQWIPMIPEAHPFVRDENEWRRCESNEEMLKGTQQHHGEWCGYSGAKKQFFFGELTSDEVGKNGMRRTRGKEFMMEDAKVYLPGWEQYEENIVRRFIEAHNGVVREIFEEQVEVKQSFNWPFAFNKDTKVFDMDGLEEEYWKAVISQPRKARHGGFHMAVAA